MDRGVLSKAGYTLNPQGNLWTKDENRFGMIIMKKMGWTSGKGLGKDEQGIQEHIKTSVNRDKRGLGFKVNAHSFEYSTEYESILSSLSKKYSKTESKREKNLKHKHRYTKIMKCKNVKLYSKKDLDSIFLKRSEISDEVPDREVSFECEANCSKSVKDGCEKSTQFVHNGKQITKRKTSLTSV